MAEAPSSTLATVTDALKRSSTENLIKKLLKAGFSREDLNDILTDRSSLIEECLALNNFAISKLKMSVPSPIEGGFSKLFEIYGGRVD